MMSSTAVYEIAETDELEALGRDSPTYDTSAALTSDQQVHPVDPPPTARWNHPICLPLIFVVLFFSFASALTGVIVSLRGGDLNNQKTNNHDTASNNGSNTLPISANNPASTKDPASTFVNTYTVKLLNKLPHNVTSFTQGFEYSNGFFYESTGRTKRSTLRKVRIETGEVVQMYTLPEPDLFGEGMTLHTTHHIFMLTWKAGRGFIFNQSTFELVKEWNYSGEGWGLTMDRAKNEVYMSDGTSYLRILDPEDLSERRRVKITLRGKPVRNLNEIEWVCDEIWANIWLTSNIYRIDPHTGVVKSIVDVSSLPPREDARRGIDVLNGIAFDKTSGRLWLTGKLWPNVYQVSINDDPLDLTKCK